MSNDNTLYFRLQPITIGSETIEDAIPRTEPASRIFARIAARVMFEESNPGHEDLQGSTLQELFDQVSSQLQTGYLFGNYILDSLNKVCSNSVTGSNEPTRTSENRGPYKGDSK